MSKPARVVAAGLMVLVLSWLCGQVVAAPPTQPRASACRPAVTIAGHLYCGVEVNAVLTALCGRHFADADPGRVHDGDAVALADGCRVHGRIAGPELLALGVSIDLNSASPLELEALPGIGPALARRIVAARPLRRVDDLLGVDGIGKVRLAGVRPHVHVDLLIAPAGP